MTEETLEDAYYRIARESAVWRERAMRLQMSPAEREALLWFTGGNGPVCPRNMAIIRGLVDRHADRTTGHQDSLPAGQGPH